MSAARFAAVRLRRTGQGGIRAWRCMSALAPRKVLGTDAYERLRSNWSENVDFKHASLKLPSDASELAEIITGVPPGGRVRVVGSAHSFNEICDAGEGETLICLANMGVIHDIDVENMTVTVQGGVTYGNLCRFLAKRGCALSMLASLPHITVAGAISTGTHGSGLGHCNLASQVSALEIVQADGARVRLARADADPSAFKAAAVSLGCLGAISEITLDVVPEYEVSAEKRGGWLASRLTARASI
jgi:xylitol oxidase